MKKVIHTITDSQHHFTWNLVVGMFVRVYHNQTKQRMTVQLKFEDGRLLCLSNEWRRELRLTRKKIHWMWTENLNDNEHIRILKTMADKYVEFLTHKTFFEEE